MEQTYKNLLKLSKLYPDQNADLNNVTLEYQRTEDPICFSFVFCKLYAYMLTQSEKYFYLTESDKSSFCVEELSSAMKDYNPTLGTKIITLFDRYLNNCLRREADQLSYDKRRANNASACYDHAMAYKNETESEYAIERIEVLESLRTMNLNDRELKYCDIILRSPVASVNDTDMAKRLGLCPSGVFQLKKRLSRKLSFAI